MTSPVNMGSDGQKAWVVTEADRDAAEDAYLTFGENTPNMVWLMGLRQGLYDDDIVVQAFAKHRHEAQAELVEALWALTKAVNTPELAAAMACHDVVAFANVEDALKLALPLLRKIGGDV